MPPVVPPAVRTEAEPAMKGETAAAVADAEPELPSADEEAPAAIWPDDSMESAFRAEARERGEPVRVAREPEETEEAAETGGLPRLDELVERIPAGVREAMEDLFRARFVAVKRVPRKALKS
jgi:hypothetical protein